MTSLGYRAASRFPGFIAASPEFTDGSGLVGVAASNPLPCFALHPWPVLLPPHARVKLETASTGVVAAIRELPRRAFGGDPRQVAAFYDLDGVDWAELALSDPNGIAAALFRGDFVWTSAGWKCLEVNAGDGAGGWMIPLLGAAYCKVGPLAEFCHRESLVPSWTNTTRLLFAHVIGRVRVALGADEVNTAIVASQSEAEFGPELAPLYQREYADALGLLGPRLRGELCICRGAELTFREGEVWFAGRRIHAVVGRAADRDGVAERRVVGAFKARKVDLYTGPATRIINDKRNLALLSDERQACWLTKTERDLIDATVPWTRLARRGAVRFEGNVCELLDLVAGRRERFVLKRGSSDGGRHVYLGRSTPAPIWDQVMRRALADGGWVVQEHVEALPAERLPCAEGSPPCHIVWGAFVIADRFSGGFGRVLSRGGYRPASGCDLSAYDAWTMRASANGDERIEVVPLLDVREERAV